MVPPHLLFQPGPPLDRQHLDRPEKGRHGGVLEAAVRGAQRPAHGVRVQDEVPRDDCRQNQGVVHGRHVVADSDQGLALGALADRMDQLLNPVDLLSRVTHRFAIGRIGRIIFAKRGFGLILFSRKNGN